MVYDVYDVWRSALSFSDPEPGHGRSDQGLSFGQDGGRACEAPGAEAYFEANMMIRKDAPSSQADRVLCTGWLIFRRGAESRWRGRG